MTRPPSMDLSKFRVLHVDVNLDRRRGGAPQACMSLCRALRAVGVAADVAATEVPGTGAHSLSVDYPEVPCHVFPQSFPARFNHSSSLASWLSSHVRDYDVVEIHEIFASPPILAYRACKKFGKPYFLNTHGGLFQADLAKRRWLKRVFRRPFLIPLLRNARVVKAATELEARTMVTYGTPVRVVVVPIPVEGVRRGDGARFRAAHGIPRDAFTVGCLARFDPAKGLDTFILAFAEFRKTHPNAWFLLIGSGSPAAEAEIRAQIGSAGLDGHSTLPGFLNGAEKADALAACDVYVQPSRRENFSIAIAEAMSMGLPVLVSDQIGLAPLVSENRCGLIFSPTVEGGAAGLREAWSRRDDWDTFGTAGRDVFKNHLSTEATARIAADLYRDRLSAPAVG